MSVVARQKPPYWLGWPGTSYDVEGERARYTQAIADAGRRVGVEIVQEAQPLEDNAAVAAFVKKVQAEKPDAVLVTLQHLAVAGAWRARSPRPACPRSSLRRSAPPSPGMSTASPSSPASTSSRRWRCRPSSRPCAWSAPSGSSRPRECWSSAATSARKANSAS